MSSARTLKRVGILYEDADVVCTIQWIPSRPESCCVTVLERDERDEREAQVTGRRTYLNTSIIALALTAVSSLSKTTP